MFVTKTWGFDDPCGPLQFSQLGWRGKARQQLQPGDRVLIIGTKGTETKEVERGMTLGVMEPTTDAVQSLDFDVPRADKDYDDEGHYKWPFALLNKNAWIIEDRKSWGDISDRDLYMDAAQGIVLLTQSETAKVEALRSRRVQLLERSLLSQGRTEGMDVVRRRSSPPPTGKRRGVMHMRRSPAYTYVMEIVGQPVRGIGPQTKAFKIGWAFDVRLRARVFNQASMPALGGLRYVPILFHLWSAARSAYRLEQALLNLFDTHRHRSNHEVVEGISKEDIERAWTELVVQQTRT